MTLRLYNTMSRAKEDFSPREPGRVLMYVCGPTVYNHIHIGNARTFLSFDVVRRYLTWRGFEVSFIQNITDVDDKIIRAANEEGVPPATIAARYTEAFLEAMDRLGILPPTAQPRATETIEPMISMTERLIETGHAYEADGSVYFSVRSFPGYGRLSRRDIDEMRSGARVEVDERKTDPLDFALWKAAKPGEPHWSSPWGEGRPGWHLECSVMSEMELGTPFDIHGGATDLIFPHHENELAQSEAATGRPFVRYWMHGGLLQINAEKMSKSLGNFVLLKDVLEQHPAAVVRLLMLQTHYRSPLDFSEERLTEAASALERLVNMVRLVRWACVRPADGPGAPPDDLAALSQALEATRGRFTAEMDDDFNTAGALAVVFGLVRHANGFLAANESVLDAEGLALLDALQREVTDLLAVFGVTLPGADEEPLPRGVVALAASVAGYAGDDPVEAVNALLAAREEARSLKDWTQADAVRVGLQELGVVIEDTPAGARVSVRGD